MPANDVVDDDDEVATAGALAMLLTEDRRRVGAKPAGGGLLPLALVELIALLMRMHALPGAASGRLRPCILKKRPHAASSNWINDHKCTVHLTRYITVSIPLHKYEPLKPRRHNGVLSVPQFVHTIS